MRAFSGLVSYWRLPWLLILLFSLSACGFHLRGYSKLPDILSPIRIVAPDLDSAQKDRLSRRLIQAGARLAQEDAINPVRLTVSIEAMPERSIADSAGSGTTILRIARQLRYSLRMPDDVATEPGVLVRSLDFEQDNKNLLAAQSEKKAALLSLERDLFDQLIFRLKRL